MRTFYQKISLLVCLASHLLLAAAQGQPAGTRVALTTITPSLNTGQNYAPWLNDDLNDLVQSEWSAVNQQYIDVTLTLAKPTNITRLSLYDYQGTFADQPASIYALNGTQRTLLGVFTGEAYQQWVTIAVSTPVEATALVVHKYGNNIPQKIQVFGLPIQAVISFASLPSKMEGSAPFDLVATSNNSATPITFASSNPAVVAVSNATGRWQATVGSVGSATITASQAANATYLAAADVVQPQVVQGAATSGTGKIPLEPQRWYQLTNSPDGIEALFDGVTDANVRPGYGKLVSPHDAYYALRAGETFTIESVKFYDFTGMDPAKPFTLSILTDTWERIPIATFTGEQYQRWVGPYPSRPGTFTLDSPVSNARYLVMTTSGLYPTEMELYGSYTIPKPVPPPSPSTLATQKQIKFKQSLGINAFEWDLEHPNRPSVVDTARLRAIKNFTGIRHYLDWIHLEKTEGQYTFNPSHEGGWNYDAMYARLKQEGMEVLVCLKDMPPWLQATYPAEVRRNDLVPVRYGKSFLDPQSYIEQAKVAFQFTARYGSNPNVDRNLVRVNTNQPNWWDPANEVKVGLNLIKYLECDNERDKWWAGRLAHQTAYEYAANLSAYYDGHKNTMGPGVGVKNADPTMQVVMGGLSVADPGYVKGMIDWCRQHRGYKADGSVDLCWDVINYHLYSDDAGSTQSGTSARGTAPEVANAGQIAKAFVQMAHEYAGGMPVWMSEAGYDLNQGSPLKAIAVGSRSVLETQADWILRTALAYARWGVERVFMYQAYDDNPQSTTKFASMGFLNTDKTPRPAAQYLSQANQLIGAYTYKQTLHEDPLVDRYELNGESAYVLVVPDERGRTVPYTLDLSGATYADVYRPTIGSQAMAVQRVNLQNGQLVIEVTETPVFVLAPGAIPPSMCAGTGSLTREQWDNVNGSDLAAIPLTTAPSSSAAISQFESAPTNAYNYGARVRGYVCPPTNGAYTFWLTGDAAAELYLSPDADPAHKVRIAACTSYTSGPRDYDRYASQKSAVITLQAGQRYYIEALHKQDWGPGYVSVAWQVPGAAARQEPIAGAHLLPFAPTASRDSNPALLSASASSSTASELSVYPNPFSQRATVQFRVAKGGPATLALYDLRGRLVRELFAGLVAAGEARTVSLEAPALNAGLYLVRLRSASGVVNYKLSFSGH